MTVCVVNGLSLADSLQLNGGTSSMQYLRFHQGLVENLRINSIAIMAWLPCSHLKLALVHLPFVPTFTDDQPWLVPRNSMQYIV